MSNILFLGDHSRNYYEWFTVFNAKFFEFLQTKKIKPEIIKLTGREPNDHAKRNLFGYEISYNLNNLIIANDDTKKCVLFTTFFDTLMLKHGLKNLPLEHIQAIYTGHYDETIIARNWPEMKDKIKPWFFRPWFYEDEYQQNCWNPTNNNIYFRGLLISSIRTLLTHLEHCNVPGIDIKPEKSPNYFEEVKSCGVAFSMSGIRDMCCRDIELWRMGIPFIRPRFTSKLIVPIPDDTYIPVDWDYDYRHCTPAPTNIEVLTKDIVEKYKEVIGNKKLLTQTSTNGYNFYKDNFTTKNIIEKSFEILQQENIV